MSHNISGKIEYRYAACQQTALCDDLLAEVGRITVHYALFVAQARKLVQELNAYNLGEWNVCPIDDLIRNLPAILESLETRCSDEYREWLSQGIRQVAIAQSAMDRIRLSIWGMSRDDGVPIATSTHILSIDCQPSILDVHRYTRGDLYTIAMEVTLATRQLAYIKQEISAMWL